MAKSVAFALLLGLLLHASASAQSTELALDFRLVAGVLSIANLEIVTGRISWSW